MKKLIVLAVIAIGVLFFAGVIHLNRSDNRVTITIETKKLGEETGKALEKGKEVTSEVMNKVKQESGSR